MRAQTRLLEGLVSGHGDARSLPARALASRRALLMDDRAPHEARRRSRPRTSALRRRSTTSARRRRRRRSSTRPDALTDEEYRIIKLPPGRGRRDGLGAGRRRADGDGPLTTTSASTAAATPMALRGDQIPLGARIIAVGRHLRRDHLRPPVPCREPAPEGDRHPAGRRRGRSSTPRSCDAFCGHYAGEGPPGAVVVPMQPARADACPGCRRARERSPPRPKSPPSPRSSAASRRRARHWG